MSRIPLMTPERVRRTVSRLAYEIVERNRGSDRLVVFGIRSRGVAFARQIAAELETVEGRPFPVYALDTNPFRDDREPDTPSPTDDAPRVDGYDVLLVDDVLFTGRTVRAALEAVVAHGRPRSIQLAVLVDRGRREYPIQPDYVGRTFPVKTGARVVVELGDETAVFLDEPAR